MHRKSDLAQVDRSINRRRLLRTLTGALGAATFLRNEARAEGSRASGGEIKAVAFDGFVIFDPRVVVKRVIEQIPDKGAEFANLWRTRQFEYCWLRTAAGKYVDFWRVTDDALRYTAKSLQVSLTGAQHDDLMDSYNKLPPWPDVREELTKLRRSGIRMAFLSNFTAAMLNANLKEAQLLEFFEPHLTTDRVRAYKPSPRAYQMGLDRFLLQKHAIAFAAFAAWDAAGASWFGYPTIWVNRAGSSEEELQAAPHAIARDLGGLTKFLGSP